MSFEGRFREFLEKLYYSPYIRHSRKYCIANFTKNSSETAFLKDLKQIGNYSNNATHLNKFFDILIETEVLKEVQRVKNNKKSNILVPKYIIDLNKFAELWKNLDCYKISQEIDDNEKWIGSQ